MKEVNIVGYSLKIWNELDKILNDINNENDSIRISLKFLDGKNVSSLKRLNIFYSKLQRDNVNFVLSYNFVLTKDRESGWLKFAENMREGMLEQVRELDKELIKVIDKIIFNFNVPTANKNNLIILKEIKNLSPTSNERFKINFLIQKYLYQIEIAVPNNDRNGWISAFNLLKDENTKCKKFKNEISSLVGKDKIVAYKFPLKLEVVLNNNNDSTNLRYFLPLWNHYKNEYDVSLHVLCSDMSLGYRVLQLFSKINFKPNVTYGEQALIELKDFIASDIFPLLELKSETDLDAICLRYIDIFLRWISDFNKYKGDYDKKLDFNVKQQLRDSLFGLIIENSLSEDKDINKEQLLKAYITENLFIKLKNVSKLNKNKNLSDLDIGTRAEIEKLLGEFNENAAIEIIYEQISIISNDNKILINEFLQNIPNKFEFMIYLVLMRNYIYERNIYRIKADDKFDLDSILIKDTWFNSKTYAEGLLQIIENALIHSEGQVAYFGMRIYNADPSVTMSALTKESSTREMLWHKYWDKLDERNEKKKLNLKIRKKEINDPNAERIKDVNTNNANNIFNLKDENGSNFRYPNFIEFYLLDDALDKNDNALGIVNKMQETLLKINSIEQIFELTEDDYLASNRLSFYIQHYGMRWLMRHVETLNGLIEIYSPFACTDVEINTADKIKQESANKERAYSNVFENLGDDHNVDWDNLYSTEYSILIPLEYARDK